MSEIAARCRECGYEQFSEFAPCPVCGAAISSWWCGACNEWRDSKLCLGCGGALTVPRLIELGEFPPGAAVPVRFSVRNPGKKPLDFSIPPGDLALISPGSRRTLRPGESIEVHGTLRLGRYPPGRREFKVQFAAATPVETTLVVDVVPAVVRLEFTPSEVTFRNAVPGKALRRTLELKNRGNVALAVKLRSTESWLSVAPERVELAAGATTAFAISAKTRRTHYGERTAKVVAEAEGQAWEVPVTVRLPEPKLEAEGPIGAVTETLPVDLGTIHADRATYESVTLRNIGRVRAACTLSTDAAWLAVTPKRVNFPVDGEKIIKLRATSPMVWETEGRRRANVVVSLDGRELLRVPVSAMWHAPKAVLAPIRRQTIGSVANDAPTTRGFRIANSGDGRLVCAVSADVPWVEILTPNLDVGAGKKRRVELRIDAPQLPVGKHTAIVSVRTNGGNLDVPLSVVVVEPRPELEILGDVELETVAADGRATGAFAVRNVGVGLLSLRAEAEDSRVALPREPLSIAPGLPVKLPVAVSVAGLSGGDHRFGVRFTSNGGSGRAEVLLRLSNETFNLPTLIDMGDCISGRWKGDALRMRNKGNTAVTLRFRGEPKWLRLDAEQVTVRPGELVAVPFTVAPPAGLSGAIQAGIRVEGRTLRHEVAVRVMARIVDVSLKPQVVELGDMKRGEQRTVAIEVANKGDLSAHVHASHAAGPLEVWVPAANVEPGTTATVSVRVRLNAGEIGKQVRAMVSVAEGLSVRLNAKVARKQIPRFAAAFAAGSGLLAGVVLGVTDSWFSGIATVGAGLIAAGGCLLLGDG